MPAIDPAAAALLEAGPGLIVGTVWPDGTPCVARAWGLTLPSTDPPVARLLVPSDDMTLLSLLGEGSRVAVTAGNVRSYRALQVKGRSLGIEEACDDDDARARQYIEAFFVDVHDINGWPRELCARMVPIGFAACVLAIDELFDQTPGPGAGAPLEARVT